MNSRIVTGHLTHARLEPIRHEFNYPVYLCLFDLAELEQLTRQTRLFGHNQIRPVSLHDADYLSGSGSIQERVVSLLRQNGLASGIARILLVTAARYFHYVFNPVNFYFCYAPGGTLECLLAEVNNTFHEKHVYLLRPRPGRDQGEFFACADKAFHVSPFNNLQGHYEFRFADPREKLDIRIDLFREGSCIMVSRVWGELRPFTSAELRRTLLRFPLSAVLTMPRILWQAFRLYRKRLPVHRKPIPLSPLTIRTTPPSLLQRFSENRILEFLCRLRNGGLRLELPNGETRWFGDSSSSLQAALKIRSHSFFWHCLKAGDVGFGESFVEDEWDTGDLTELLRLLIENQEALDDREIRFAWVGRRLNRLRHLHRKNTQRQSRENIQAHYDLSNDFFQSFLDPSLMYSCAYFHSPGETLEQAQQNKLRTLIHKAALEPADHVLEIGSGWGSFAIEAARSTGCRVTSITLSEEQLKLARERALQAGVGDRVEFRLCDYRFIQGQYDKIVSIEMLEAVGHEYLGTFFGACDRLLNPDGLVLLQVITIPDQRYETYRKGSDWIQKYIFPGGMLPSLTALCQAMTRHSSLMVEEIENIGIHYARTLRLWRENFLASRERLSELGFDRRFQRMWLYYLCYCEAGFATRTLGDLQLVLTRPKNRKLPEFKLPTGRSHV